jgi:hypothetical protein
MLTLKVFSPADQEIPHRIVRRKKLSRGFRVTYSHVQELDEKLQYNATWSLELVVSRWGKTLLRGIFSSRSNHKR